MIAVSVKVFHGDAKVVIRENPSLLKETPVTARLGFPDVVFPGDVRNEVYVKLWSGEFSFTSGGSVRRSLVNLTSASTGPPNVQVTVEARRRNGNVIDSVICSGSGEPPVTQYHSLVFHRNSMPTFGELLKLSLPVDLLPHCHLFFTFRTRSSRDRGSNSSKNESERPFAFAYFPLFTNNNAVQDGSHTLVLYRADRAGPMTPAEYFDAPPTLTGTNPLSLSIPPSVARTAVLMKDSLVIRSLLCSTTFTHSKFLLGLLHWEEITDPGELSNCLMKFTFIGEHEIVKFLTEIFNSLFKILASPRNQSGEMDDLVFNALVKVLGIVQDRRFSNFQPVLEVYIDKHFNCPVASSHIIRSMNRLLANPNGSETAISLRAALKVWPYIFKFIAKSRELQKVKEIAVGGGATAIHLDSTFKRELRSHLEQVNQMMSNTSSSAIGTQTIAMKKFTSILPHLAKIFNTAELVVITTSFASAIPVDGKAKLAAWKLIMCLEVVKGFLFDIPQARVTLVEAITNHIRPHFGRFDEYSVQPPPATDQAKDTARIAWLENTRLCISIMAVMLDRLQQALVDPDTLTDQRRLREEQGNVDYLLFLFPK
jgi:dedicator of cytokinesis protein 3